MQMQNAKYQIVTENDRHPFVALPFPEAPIPAIG